MICPPKAHEIFYPFDYRFAGLTTVAQILNEARIVDGQPSESCPGHIGFVQKYFNISQ